MSNLLEEIRETLAYCHEVYGTDLGWAEAAELTAALTVSPIPNLMPQPLVEAPKPNVTQAHFEATEPVLPMQIPTEPTAPAGMATPPTSPSARPEWATPRPTSRPESHKTDLFATAPRVDLFGTALPSAASQSVSLVRSPYKRIEALIPPGHAVLSLESLADLAQYVAETVLIPLDQTRKNPVFGVGKPDADLMVIGEAPGADEDLRGEPFVGAAGQLLTKMLAAIGFARSDVYIANILKSRPPNNRDPEPTEIAAHVPILYKQIALIQPKIILCMGRISGQTLAAKPNASLSRLRGQWLDFHGLDLAVTYHPAALLRNEQWKRPTWEDLKMVRRRYDESQKTA